VWFVLGSLLLFLLRAEKAKNSVFLVVFHLYYISSFDFHVLAPRGRRSS